MFKYKTNEQQMQWNSRYKNLSKDVMKEGDGGAEI